LVMGDLGVAANRRPPNDVNERVLPDLVQEVLTPNPLSVLTWQAGWTTHMPRRWKSTNFDKRLWSKLGPAQKSSCWQSVREAVVRH